jgi:4-amino-4-deoxy-L-arabinose transferase-like glycosyltransferase
MPLTRFFIRHPHLARLGAIMLVALSLRATLLSANVVPFNADESVVALMARHILQGARPVFFYGQAYLGSLDAWLIAGAFLALGESVLTIRLVQTALFLGIIATTYALAWRVYRQKWIAGVSALLMAVPPVLVSLYTTATLGGYGETLLIGHTLALLALHLGQGAGAWYLWLLLGALGGLGFWGFPLLIVYLIPIGVYLLWAGWARPRALWGPAALALVGFALGASPWWGYTLAHGFITVTEAAGSAIAGNWHPILSLPSNLFNFALFGLTVIAGMRPPWSARFLGLALAPYILIVYTALFVFLARRLTRQRPSHSPQAAGRWLLGGVAVTTIAGFVFTPFGTDPSGRYFLPMTPMLAILLAEMLFRERERLNTRLGAWRKWLGNAFVLLLVMFNAWGTLQCAVAFPPGLTTQFDPVAQVDHRDMPALIAFLRARGETRGYSNYWVAFPLAFLSHEDLIFASRLPYHQDFRYTPRDDRYAPFTDAVTAGDRAAYITTHHPALNERLRAGFTKLGVTFQETQIGDYTVFYALSRKVLPPELGLGEQSQKPEAQSPK